MNPFYWALLAVVLLVGLFGLLWRLVIAADRKDMAEFGEINDGIEPGTDADVRPL